MKDFWGQRSAPRIVIIDDNPNIHRDFDLVLVGQTQDPAFEAEERRFYGAKAANPVLKTTYRLDHALSGLEGVEKVENARAEGMPYQLAFVDIRMPGIDGVETIERVWRVDPDIQVVICTAYADYTWEDLVRRLGPTDNLLVLKKPFDHIEVTLLASTLTEKWFLGRQAAVKYEELARLVARRTQKLLELQQYERPVEAALPTGPDGPVPNKELPLLLLVESDAKVASQVGQGLGDAYRVILARDGDEALRQAQETVPDLVITELRAPRLDGLDLCRCLKRAEITSHIPVIMVAPPGQRDSQGRTLEVGADHCLVKPLSLPQLKARVDELLQARSGVHEHLASESCLQRSDLAANQADAQFLRRVLETVDRLLSDYEFDVEALAKEVAVSRRQLFRKLKALTGGTPHALIRDMRLKRAGKLLKESRMTVTEITYAVGFFDLKHFRSVFLEHFGVLPGEYARQVPQEERAENELGTTPPRAQK